MTTYFDKTAIIVQGKGTELNSSKVLEGRAKRKTITQTSMLKLVDVCNKKFIPERKQAYWNTYHCQNKLITANGRLYGKYCKNRFCTLCCSIRKAEITNKYLPVLKTWDEPYFVTLTIKSPSLRNLNKFMQGMITAFQRINTKYRKQKQRKKGIQLVGIKSLECNFNPEMKTYNPHFHLIAKNKAIAETLIKEWLQIWTSKYTTHKAQIMKPINNNETALIELIKYGSKIFTESDLNQKIKSGRTFKVYVAALNNIFTAMQGLRIFERFGFNLPKQSKERIGATVVKDYEQWFFVLKYSNWLNSENETILTGHSPEAQLINLLENNIDTDLE